MYDSAPLEPSLKDKHGEERAACLLRNGARLPSPGRSGLLHALLREKCPRMVQTLIQHGMDPRVVDEEGQPLLAVAVEHSDVDLVKCLLTHGCADHWNTLCKRSADAASLAGGSGEKGAFREQDAAVHCNATSTEPTTRDWFRAGGATSPSITHCDTTTLLEVAATRVDEGMQRSLRKAGIWSGDVRLLHAAALSLNRTALSFVVENGDWEDGEVSDAMKLQSAVYLFTDCLLHQRAVSDGYGNSASKKAVEEALSHLEKTTTHRVHDLERDDLRQSATELFEAATRMTKVESASSSDLVTSFDLRSEGESPLEARTAAEFMQLCKQEGLCDKETFGRLYLHGLLVMLRLQPEHSFLKIFTMVLASQLTGQNFMDPSRRTSCTAYRADSYCFSPRSQSDRSDASLTLACHAVAAFCQATSHVLSKEKSATCDMLLSISPLFYVITMALQAGLPCGTIYAIAALEWLGQCMSRIHSETVQQDQEGSQKASRYGQVEEIAVHILAHLAVTTDDSSSGLTNAVKAFTQLTTAACFQDGRLFHTLFRQFSRTIFQVPLEADRNLKDACEPELLPDEHLEPICSSLLSEGVQLPHLLAVMAATLLDQGMALPNLPEDLVHCLLQQHFSELLEVLVSHGLDVWIMDSSGTPLICSAIRQYAFSSTLLALLRGITTKLPSNHSNEEVEAEYLQQLKDHGGDRWDLWVLAVESGNLSNAQALHEHRIPARREALLSAAVQADEKMFEFLLKTRTWSDIDQRDAFYVRCACHLYDWLKRTEAAMQRRQAYFSLPSAAVGVETTDSCLSQLPAFCLSESIAVPQGCH